MNLSSVRNLPWIAKIWIYLGSIVVMTKVFSNLPEMTAMLLTFGGAILMLCLLGPHPDHKM